MAPSAAALAGRVGAVGRNASFAQPIIALAAVQDLGAMVVALSTQIARASCRRVRNEHVAILAVLLLAFQKKRKKRRREEAGEIVIENQ